MRAYWEKKDTPRRPVGLHIHNQAIPEDQWARLVRLSLVTGATVQSLLDDAIDFYLDGCGA